MESCVDQGRCPSPLVGMTTKDAPNCPACGIPDLCADSVNLKTMIFEDAAGCKQTTDSCGCNWQKSNTDGYRIVPGTDCAVGAKRCDIECAVGAEGAAQSSCDPETGLWILEGCVAGLPCNPDCIKPKVCIGGQCQCEEQSVICPDGITTREADADTCELPKIESVCGCTPLSPNEVPTGYSFAGDCSTHSCRVQCADGYTGQSSSQCDAVSATWTFSGCTQTPECDPITNDNAPAGYVITQGCTGGSCVAQCAEGYEGVADVVCTGNGYQFNGCTKKTCPPLSPTQGSAGYKVECNATGQNCTVSCAVPYIGNPATECVNGAIQFSGCNLCTAKEIPQGYKVIDGCDGKSPCEVGCAEGYEGQATVKCEVNGGSFIFDGCVPSTGPICQPVNQAPEGYTLVGDCTQQSCRAQCADGWTGTVNVTCQANGVYGFSGCTKKCNPIDTAPEGYVLLKPCDGGQDGCPAQCAQGWSGTPRVTCNNEGNFVFDGCTKDPVDDFCAPVVKVPEGYGYKNGTCDGQSSMCSAYCIDGYTGTAVAECVNGHYVFSGCVKKDPCKPVENVPAGYRLASNCDGKTTTCVAKCADDLGFYGTANVYCDESKGEYVFEGCNQGCVMPNPIPDGYSVAATNCNSTKCFAKCAEGYVGEAVATCEGNVWRLTGCGKCGPYSNLDTDRYQVNADGTISCKQGWTATPPATICVNNGKEYVQEVSGCDPVCTHPKPLPNGYICGIPCDDTVVCDKTNFFGTPRKLCRTPGDYIYTGCEPCVLPSSIPEGYLVNNCAEGQCTSKDVQCAKGFEGVPALTCVNGQYFFSGCFPVDCANTRCDNPKYPAFVNGKCECVCKECPACWDGSVRTPGPKCECDSTQCPPNPCVNNPCGPSASVGVCTPSTPSGYACECADRVGHCPNTSIPVYPNPSLQCALDYSNCPDPCVYNNPCGANSLCQNTATGVNCACKRDARICPDGKTVSRVAPSCEFAPCADPCRDPKVNNCTDVQICTPVIGEDNIYTGFECRCREGCIRCPTATGFSTLCPDPKTCKKPQCPTINPCDGVRCPEDHICTVGEDGNAHCIFNPVNGCKAANCKDCISLPNQKCVWDRLTQGCVPAGSVEPTRVNNQCETDTPCHPKDCPAVPADAVTICWDGRTKQGPVECIRGRNQVCEWVWSSCPPKPECDENKYNYTCTFSINTTTTVQTWSNETTSQTVTVTTTTTVTNTPVFLGWALINGVCNPVRGCLPIDGTVAPSLFTSEEECKKHCTPTIDECCGERPDWAVDTVCPDGTETKTTCNTTTCEWTYYGCPQTPSCVDLRSRCKPADTATATAVVLGYGVIGGVCVPLGSCMASTAPLVVFPSLAECQKQCEQVKPCDPAVDCGDYNSLIAPLHKCPDGSLGGIFNECVRAADGFCRFVTRKCPGCGDKPGRNYRCPGTDIIAGPGDCIPVTVDGVLTYQWTWVKCPDPCTRINCKEESQVCVVVTDEAGYERPTCQCKNDTKVCPDGRTRVFRNPKLDCDFMPCPPVDPCVQTPCPEGYDCIPVGDRRKCVKPDPCPQILCAPLPEGCTYKDPVFYDGCLVSCGRMSCECEKNQFRCDAPVTDDGLVDNSKFTCCDIGSTCYKGTCKRCSDYEEVCYAVLSSADTVSNVKYTEPVCCPREKTTCNRKTGRCDPIIEDPCNEKGINSNATQLIRCGNDCCKPGYVCVTENSVKMPYCKLKCSELSLDVCQKYPNECMLSIGYSCGDLTKPIYRSCVDRTDQKLCSADRDFPVCATRRSGETATFINQCVVPDGWVIVSKGRCDCGDVVDPGCPNDVQRCGRLCCEKYQTCEVINEVSICVNKTVEPVCNKGYFECGANTGVCCPHGTECKASRGGLYYCTLPADPWVDPVDPVDPITCPKGQVLCGDDCCEGKCIVVDVISKRAAPQYQCVLPIEPRGCEDGTPLGSCKSEFREYKNSICEVTVCCKAGKGELPHLEEVSVGNCNPVTTCDDLKCPPYAPCVYSLDSKRPYCSEPIKPDCSLVHCKEGYVCKTLENGEVGCVKDDSATQITCDMIRCIEGYVCRDGRCVESDKHLGCLHHTKDGGDMIVRPGASVAVDCNTCYCSRSAPYIFTCTKMLCADNTDPCNNQCHSEAYCVYVPGGESYCQNMIQVVPDRLAVIAAADSPSTTKSFALRKQRALADELAVTCDKAICGHGTCARGRCYCEEGWTGPRCDLKSCAVDADCGKGNFACVTKSTTPYCICKQGWTGDRCEIEAPACSTADPRKTCTNDNLVVCAPGFENVDASRDGTGPCNVTAPDAIKATYYIKCNTNDTAALDELAAEFALNTAAELKIDASALSVTIKPHTREGVCRLDTVVDEVFIKRADVSRDTGNIIAAEFLLTKPGSAYAAVPSIALAFLGVVLALFAY